MKRKASASHDEAIVRRLRKDPEFAAEYLKSALEDDDDPGVLLIALRHLVQAQSIAKVAKAAGIERESLYRALSLRGNRAARRQEESPRATTAPYSSLQVAHFSRLLRRKRCKGFVVLNCQR